MSTFGQTRSVWLTSRSGVPRSSGSSFRRRIVRYFRGIPRALILGQRTSSTIFSWHRPTGTDSGARVLVLLGDSVTTDHISPAGAIAAESPAGRYLLDHGVTPEEFNSYGAGGETTR